MCGCMVRLGLQSTGRALTKSPGITQSGLAGPCPDPPAHFQLCRQPVGTWLLHPLHKSYPGCRNRSRAPAGPQMAQPSWNPLAQQSCVVITPVAPTQACWPLPSSLCWFPTLYLYWNLQEIRSCYRFHRLFRRPSLGGPAFFSGGGHAFSCLWGGRKAGVDEGQGRNGGSMSKRWSWVARLASVAASLP